MNPPAHPPVTVHSLVGSAQAELALQCLGSLVAAVPFPVRFTLHDDGSLDAPARERLAGALGVPCTFVGQRAGAEQVAERLRNHPLCAKFRREHLFGAKLFDVPLLAAGRAVYADTDVLWTRPVDCPAFFRGGGPAFVVMRDLQESYAVRLSRWPLLQSRGIRLASRFCAGLMSLDPAALDLDYIEFLLKVDAETGIFDGFRFWTEQTVHAALAARAGCAWIDPRECMVVHPSNLGRTRHAAILHFAGFSRPLFAARHARVRFEPAGKALPQVLQTVHTPTCGIGRRVLSACRQRLLLRDHGRTALPVPAENPFAVRSNP